MIKKYVIFELVNKTKKFESEVSSGGYSYSYKHITYLKPIETFDTELECIQHIENLYGRFIINTIYING